MEGSQTETAIVQSICVLGIACILATPLQAKAKGAFKQVVSNLRRCSSQSNGFSSDETKELLINTEASNPAPTEDGSTTTPSVNGWDLTQISDKLPDQIEYDLTEGEMQKLTQLKKELGVRNAKAGSQRARVCTDPSLCRFLRARQWHVKKTAAFMEESLQWRERAQPEKLRWDDVKEEGRSGKIYRMFQDKEGRPVVLFRPGRENTNNHAKQIQYLTYQLERASRMLDEGDHTARGSDASLSSEQMVWLIDFTGWSLRNSPPLKTSAETLHVLQTGYPERLGRAILWNPPQIFSAFWRAVRPFVDPKTRQKIHTVSFKTKKQRREALEQYFDPAFVESDLGGDLTKGFDFNQFSEQMRVEDKLADRKLAREQI